MTTYKFKADNTGVLELRQNSQQRAADLYVGEGCTFITVWLQRMKTLGIPWISLSRLEPPKDQTGEGVWAPLPPSGHWCWNPSHKGLRILAFVLPH